MKAIYLTLLLSACAISPVAVCGANQTFTPGEEDAIAEQLAIYRDGTPMRDMAEDWARMRAENRACETLKLREYP